jgi:hypothetical protein
VVRIQDEYGRAGASDISQPVFAALYGEI